MNLKNSCYQDAIFFADKILHLQETHTDKFVKAVYDLGNIYYTFHKNFQHTVTY